MQNKNDVKFHITLSNYAQFCSELSSRASDFWSKGPGFKTTSAVSKLGQLRLPHFACVFRKGQ